MPGEAHGRLPRKAEALPACRRIRMGVPWIDPIYSLGLLGRFDVKVDNDWLLVAPHQNTFERHVAVRIDLLVRHVRRDIDEVARPSFG